MNNLFSLSRNIQQARKSAGLSQKELAQKLSVSDKTISAYESSRAVPPVPTLKKIAEITHQPINVFFQEDEEDKLALINQKLDIILEEIKKTKRGPNYDK